jgi:MFS-type transporter involved in bile tolerance (Atg22 family)
MLRERDLEVAVTTLARFISDAPLTTTIAAAFALIFRLPMAPLTSEAQTRTDKLASSSRG